MGIALAGVSLVKMGIICDFVGFIELTFVVEKVVYALSISLNLIFQLIIIILLKLFVQFTVRGTGRMHRQIASDFLFVFILRGY